VHLRRRDEETYVTPSFFLKPPMAVLTSEAHPLRNEPHPEQGEHTGHQRNTPPRGVWDSISKHSPPPTRTRTPTEVIVNDYLVPELAGGFAKPELADLASAREFSRQTAAHLPAYDSNWKLRVLRHDVKER
jgi:hypothetical protein